MNQLNTKCDSIRKIAFKAMRNSLRLDSENFKQYESKFKTRKDMMLAIFTHYDKQISQLTEEFSQKYKKGGKV